MKIERFEDIIAWQKAVDFAVDVYRIFDCVKDFTIKDQMKRAAISVSNNIAEGFNRKGDKEFARFLYISLGSASEVKSMLYLSVKLGFLKEDAAFPLIERISEISRILYGLIKAVYNGLPEKKK
jgi:four helix bundle protein